MSTSTPPPQNGTTTTITVDDTTDTKSLGIGLICVAFVFIFIGGITFALLKFKRKQREKKHKLMHPSEFESLPISELSEEELKKMVTDQRELICSLRKQLEKRRPSNLEIRTKLKSGNSLGALNSRDKIAISPVAREFCSGDSTDSTKEHCTLKEVSFSGPRNVAGHRSSSRENLRNIRPDGTPRQNSSRDPSPGFRSDPSGGYLSASSEIRRSRENIKIPNLERRGSRSSVTGNSSDISVKDRQSPSPQMAGISHSYSKDEDIVSAGSDSSPRDISLTRSYLKKEGGSSNSGTPLVDSDRVFWDGVEIGTPHSERQRGRRPADATPRPHMTNHERQRRSHR